MHNLKQAFDYFRPHPNTGDTATVNLTAGKMRENLEIIRVSFDQLRFKLGFLADAVDVSGISWGGFNLIGDQKSIDELLRLKNVSCQVDVYRQGFDTRIKSEKERADLLDQVFCETCDELGCEHDNEAALMAIDKLKTQAALVPELIACLRWYIENDETNRGDVPMSDHGGYSWDEINEFWIKGLERAQTILKKAEAVDV